MYGARALYQTSYATRALIAGRCGVFCHNVSSSQCIMQQCKTTVFANKRKGMNQAESGYILLRYEKFVKEASSGDSHEIK